MSAGETTLLTSIVEEETTEGSFRVTRFSANGERHAAAIVNAVGWNWHVATGREELTNSEAEAELADGARRGDKVTLVYMGGNAFGAPMLVAREGTLFVGNSTGRVALKPKGARTKGYVIDPGKVVDIIPGYKSEEAVWLAGKARDRYPSLKPLTRERLQELPETELGRSRDCTLCVFGSWQTPEGLATDAIWLIGEYNREDDIADGAVLLIRPEYGVSEHGSVYGEQLLRANVGEVEGFEPVSFKTAVDLTDLDYEDAFQRLFGTAPVAA